MMGKEKNNISHQVQVSEQEGVDRNQHMIDPNKESHSMDQDTDSNNMKSQALIYSPKDKDSLRDKNHSDKGRSCLFYMG